MIRCGVLQPASCQGALSAEAAVRRMLVSAVSRVRPAEPFVQATTWKLTRRHLVAAAWGTVIRHIETAVRRVLRRWQSCRRRG